MARTILVLGILAGLALAAFGWPTYIGPDKEPRSWIMLSHLGASLLALLVQLWLIFDLLGTGVAVRRFAGVDPAGGAAWVGASRRHQRSALPWALVAVVAVTSLFGVAGAEASRFLSATVHKSVYAVTVLIYFWALRVEWKACEGNEALLEEVDRAERAGGPSATGQPA